MVIEEGGMFYYAVISSLIASSVLKEVWGATYSIISEGIQVTPERKQIERWTD